MLVRVTFALGGAFVANARAQFQHLAKHLRVLPGPANRQLSSRVANIRTIETDANALPHVRLLGRARIRTAEAHARAVH